MPVLLMDGVIYEEWTPTSHDELEHMFKKHYKDIFGPDSLYLDVRTALRGGSIAAIPDGYCLTFGSDRLWVIEVERSTPDPFSHIVNQLSRFINGLFDPQTQRVEPRAQRDLRDALIGGLDQEARERLRTRVGDLHPWLEQLISSPAILVVTEKATDEVRRAVGTLRIIPQVYEFRTFCREGQAELMTSQKAVHIHQFEPLFAPSGSPAPVTGQPFEMKRLVDAGLLSPGQKLFHVHKGRRIEGEILPSGAIQLSDNSRHNSPSGAAVHETGTNINGWRWWKVRLQSGSEVTLDDLRKKRHEAQ